MSRYIRNVGVHISPTAPPDVQRILAGFNQQPVTTADQLEAARELAAPYTTSRGDNIASNRRPPHPADPSDR